MNRPAAPSRRTRATKIAALGCAAPIGAVLFFGTVASLVMDDDSSDDVKTSPTASASPSPAKKPSATTTKSADKPSKPAEESKKKQTTAPTPTPSAEPAWPDASVPFPPKPAPASRAAFIADLNAIDRDIVHGDPDKAVDRARNQCSSVRGAPDDRGKLVDLTNQRFTSPDAPSGHGEATAGKILDAIRKHICPEV